jgi:alpha-tubulin suppressor-like RCC1 family protein
MFFSCAVSASNRPRCWGYNFEGYGNPPPIAVKSISAGGYNSCAIAGDQEALVCWGINQYGETNAPAGAFASVSGGGNFFCAIRSDRTITCWGDNGYGQLNLPQ